jgi:hypothetical protein
MAWHSPFRFHFASRCFRRRRSQANPAEAANNLVAALAKDDTGASLYTAAADRERFRHRHRRDLYLYRHRGPTRDRQDPALVDRHISDDGERRADAGDGNLPLVPKRPTYLVGRNVGGGKMCVWRSSDRVGCLRRHHASVDWHDLHVRGLLRDRLTWPRQVHWITTDEHAAADSRGANVEISRMPSPILSCGRKSSKPNISSVRDPTNVRMSGRCEVGLA